MSPTCDVCRDDEGEHRFDSYKDSGGGPVHTCTECTEWVRVSLRQSAKNRCFVCSTPTKGKYEVRKYGVRSRHAERSDICSDCRNRLVFNRGEPVFVSTVDGYREVEQ